MCCLRAQVLREALKISIPLSLISGKCPDFTAGHSGTLHRVLLSLEVTLLEVYNPNLHNIARSDRIGLTMKKC